ncbi:NAD-dependent epimerase/dehydratase family protein [Acidovorax sp.]|uniref:NAD-dependent epimerase/dehydratase family protein n=1 Tax=Acidovorax sp. TaxID=1872122 RepID=UPI0025C02F28|nr:NAD-dependent epimerase/dehydratase family protein [Acidovorax sp.]MBW8464939.1 NAD-dependent epimerase/dehydratase family protein [Acidovorax sp.]
MPTLLVTGAAGIVGTALRPYLRERFNLRLLDRRPVTDLVNGETALVGDLTDPTFVSQAAEGVDAVLHLACAHGTDIHFQSTVEPNYHATLYLLEAAQRAGAKRFVFASSHHVLGQYHSQAATHFDDSPVAPDSYYALSKVFGEAACATFSQRSLEARRGELNRSIETATQQAKALADEEQRARDELARLSDAAAQGGLQAALELKMEREKALGAQRSEYDDLTTKLRASDERRMQLERALDPLRARITEFQLKEQAARLGLEQYTTLLADAQADLEAVAQSITEGNVRMGGLQSEIDRLHREIAALGAVNLAALDELKLASERKVFLDAQTADLTEAMNTLEDAIRKIDGETRQLLSGTFDTVNAHFGRMFPELFGGGQAKLIITGDEILDSGVQVMAQPPGKKNQTIHLLSGGEKALTAIALVFAIFQLNPAPFCLLDEVDAPLDDANTERYAKLVSSMSKGTQFLFISHNKIAMEMAEQLIGVTMQEQGVSRIVAVDMESALSMADV